MKKITYSLAVGSAVAAYFNWLMLFVCLMFFMLYLLDTLMEFFVAKEDLQYKVATNRDDERLKAIERKLVHLENVSNMVANVKRDWRT